MQIPVRNRMRGGNVNRYTISDLRCSSCSSYTANLHPLTRIDFIGPRTVFIASHLVIIRIIHIIVFYDIGSLRTFSLPWVTLPSLCIFSRMGSHRHDQTPHREKRSRYSRRLTHDNIRNTIAIRPVVETRRWQENIRG
jgi:hypothetical protein